MFDIGGNRIAENQQLDDGHQENDGAERFIYGGHVKDDLGWESDDVGNFFQNLPKTTSYDVQLEFLSSILDSKGFQVKPNGTVLDIGFGSSPSEMFDF